MQTCAIKERILTSELLMVALNNTSLHPTSVNMASRKCSRTGKRLSSTIRTGRIWILQEVKKSSKGPPTNQGNQNAGQTINRGMRVHVQLSIFDSIQCKFTYIYVYIKNVEGCGAQGAKCLKLIPLLQNNYNIYIQIHIRQRVLRNHLLQIHDLRFSSEEDM